MNIRPSVLDLFFIGLFVLSGSMLWLLIHLHFG